MSDNFLEDKEPQLSLTQLSIPSDFVAGGTHWFDGDIAFGEVVKSLQVEGVIEKTKFELPLPYLSVSQVEQYLRCPMQYWHRYVLGKKSPPSVALVQGTSMHKALEDGYRHVLVNKNLPTLEYVHDSYSTSLDYNLTEDVVWEVDDDDDLLQKKDKGKVKDQGVALLKLWHKNKLPNVKPRAVEKSFITTMNGIPVVGKIDLVDRVDQPLSPQEETGQNHPLLDEIVDHKVVGKTYTKQLVDNKLQVSLYAHATGIPRQRYDLYVKTKIPKITEMLTSRNAQQIRWAIKIFTDVAKAISSGNFPACSPDSYMCSEKFCGYWSICRGAI